MSDYVPPWTSDDAQTRLVALRLCCSSIWQEDVNTRIVYITLLGFQHNTHQFSHSIEELSAIAHLSEKDCEAALQILEHGWIVKIDGGWRFIS